MNMNLGLLSKKVVDAYKAGKGCKTISIENTNGLSYSTKKKISSAKITPKAVHIIFKEKHLEIFRLVFVSPPSARLERQGSKTHLVENLTKSTWMRLMEECFVDR